MTALGSIEADGNHRTIRFERRLAHPVDAVWAALTEAEQLSVWLADAVVDARQGGSMTLDFGEGGKEGGLITLWDPPRALAWEWRFTGERPSHVRWELTAAGDGRSTVLRLEHTLLTDDVAPAYGAGWHGHLDQLAGLLDGEVPDWSTRYEEVLPAYSRLDVG